MRISSLIILAGFTIMGLYLVYLGTTLRKKGFSPLGKPTLHPFIFYIGKIALFTSWTFLLVNAILVMSGEPPADLFYPIPAAILVSAGTVFMILAFRDLGDSLRVGLPGESTTLKTNGIYRVSRNPIYVGVDLIAIASVLFIPVIINIAFAIIGIAVHHAIILSEEKFLEGRFREDWLSYKRKTRRYL
jgi:protein-S-isoprenylcysteine O-methyltransferase Ste14